MPRIRIIPDRVFYKLWKNSEKMPKEEFLRSMTSSLSDTKVDFKKYGIKDEEVFKLLTGIHKISHMPLDEMLGIIGMTKAEFSNAFCIPIRTVEDWYSKKNRMPGYFKLLLARYVGIIDVGNFIKTESSMKISGHNEQVPAKKKKEKRKSSKEIMPPWLQTGIADEEEAYSKLVPADKMADICDSIRTREILSMTDYISEAARKHSNK